MPEDLDLRPARGGVRVTVQKLGTALSTMVLPNIGAFIAWGLITALFIETGWVTLVGDALGYDGSYGLVEHIGGWGAGAEGTGIVGPMISYLLPILIGYAGGRMVYDDTVRGGVVGAIATIGAVTGADVPMFLGAMVMGPLGGWTMKRLDLLWQDKIRPGFEMLVNNFAAGIWGMVLAIVGYVVAGPFVEAFSTAAEKVVDFLVENSLLPLTSVFVEPAKVLFLNNAINHGVFTPLGTAEATRDGESILFLIEANPGPGLGLLLAFAVFGSGVARASAPGAAIISFVGGIHEIYFPYVLMKPRLILAVVAGGMAGVATNLVFGSGLRAPAAPGSIIAVLIQSPVGSLVGVIASVVAATGVTFAVAAVLLKLDRSGSDDLAAATADMESRKGRSSVASAVLGRAPATTTGTGQIRSIVFACDAGMGSSAMGASVLRKKVREAGFDSVTVVNKAISSLTDTVDLVVTHQDLTERAMQRTPSAIHVSVDSFMASPRYDDVVQMLRQGAAGAGSPAPAPAPAPAPSTGTTDEAGPSAGRDGNRQADDTSRVSAPAVLALDSIVLEGRAATRDAAIEEAGQLLVAEGAVPDAYVLAMHDRERSVSTYMGNGLAIPHGTDEAKRLVLRTAISYVRYPSTVAWDGERRAEFVVAVAGTGDDHLRVLSRLAKIFVDPEQVEQLRLAQTPEQVRALLDGVRPG
ncbi:PTS mannitol transporter subunit IICBA [Sanguibacter inulinus]|uniref:Mannitol-specific phosphotransferase enzyme IIA component n=1 Tax=Sanguibacter inulinus TaxID=60922 RepID=A0A853EW68_9MICO|nr:PTS mannitol transporter subunit IICBA [Sanguibacter inulinus]MBF0723690.1 PTS mannitol transporter subunit IICBA [Sanguibacter inulinus]NYS94835.1 PTS mannitol transporter subunit IICBA [Sanguibacter inulinus]